MDEAEVVEEAAVLTDEEAEDKAWCVQRLRELDAYEATLCAPADIEDKAAREAAEYDAWVRRKVREAWESARFWTAEEMEAEDEAWWAEIQRRAANEAEMGRCGEG